METQFTGKNSHILTRIDDKMNELTASAAFTSQSAVFDAMYATDTIIQYKRLRVWQHMEQYLAPKSYILELNAGTGEDAIHFAGNGHRVHATDIAEGMLDKLAQKISTRQLQQAVSYEHKSFTELATLQNKGPYDHIFSNFAGLNCTRELDKVLASISPLLQPGGFVTLVILPRFCLWEFLLIFRGKFKTAFRRFTGKKGASAHIEGNYFRCWYYNPSYIESHLKKDFILKSVEGLCTIVPPSYLQGFAEKKPSLYRFLKKKEDKWKKKWPWKYIGDYYIITLQKKVQGTKCEVR